MMGRHFFKHLSGKVLGSSSSFTGTTICRRDEAGMKTLSFRICCWYSWWMNSALCLACRGVDCCRSMYNGFCLEEGTGSEVNASTNQWSSSASDSRSTGGGSIAAWKGSSTAEGAGTTDAVAGGAGVSEAMTEVTVVDGAVMADAVAEGTAAGTTKASVGGAGADTTEAVAGGTGMSEAIEGVVDEAVVADAAAEGAAAGMTDVAVEAAGAIEAEAVGAGVTPATVEGVGAVYLSNSRSNRAD